MQQRRSVFAMMRDELECGYLEVPSQQGGYIRVPVSVNTERLIDFAQE